MSTEMTQTKGQTPAARGEGKATEARRLDWRVPPVDVFENADRILIQADLPGVSRDQLAIRVDQRALTIEGRRENGHGWRREFTLPESIDAARITAELHDGILELALPLAEKAKPRTIEIKGS
jgi:HSP20 family molecular chaperone IbpA